MTPPWRKPKASPASAPDRLYAGLTWTFRVTESYADSDTRTVTRCLLRVGYHVTFLGFCLRLLFPNGKTPIMCALRGVAVNLGTKALRRITTVVPLSFPLFKLRENRFPKYPKQINTNRHEFRHVLCVDSNGSSRQTTAVFHFHCMPSLIGSLYCLSQSFYSSIVLVLQTNLHHRLR